MDDEKTTALLQEILAQLKELNTSVNKLSEEMQQGFSGVTGPGSSGNLAKIQYRLKKIERLID